MSSDPQKLEKCAKLLEALAHPVRLQILQELCMKQTNVTSLYKNLNIPQSTVSRHLAILKNAGIVVGKRNGTQIYYCVQCDKLRPLLKILLQD